MKFICNKMRHMNLYFKHFNDFRYFFLINDKERIVNKILNGVVQQVTQSCFPSVGLVS